MKRDTVENPDLLVHQAQQGRMVRGVTMERLDQEDYLASLDHVDCSDQKDPLDHQDPQASPDLMDKSDPKGM